MKLVTVALALFVLIVLTSTRVSAANVCLLDTYGNFYVLKGGKIDKKAYTGRAYYGSSCVVPLVATAYRSGSDVALSIMSFQSPEATPVCPVKIFSVVGDDEFTAVGNYIENGQVYSINFARTTCNIQ